MIVRINQLDLLHAEERTGWPAQGLLGPVQHVWPADTHVYELLVLDRDEQQRPLTPDFRLLQMRQLIPEAIAALQAPDEKLVVRLDGPLTETELLAALHHLTDADGNGRFAVSEIRKLEPHPMDVIASMRVQPSPEALRAMCMDPGIGLEKSVRLRAFSVPENLVNPLLDVNATDDERWGEILRESGFVLTGTRGLKALQVRTSRVEPAAMKSKLIQRLSASGFRR